MRMIWCVDDDSTIRDIEVYALESTGFKARGFSDGVKMLKALEKEIPQLIILDIMMPNVDGIKILKKLKEDPRTRNIPIIMATAKGTEMDKIHGLDSGADDYLVKPFGIMEMVSRVKAVLRRCSVDIQEQIAVGDIVLCDQEHWVSVNDQRIVLTLKEYELLKMFMTHPGIVFSRERLLADIWGIHYVGESRTVDMHIKTLRAKLGTAGKQIETVIGVGYRLEDKK